MTVGSDTEEQRECINDEVRHRYDTVCYLHDRSWEAGQKH